MASTGVNIGLAVFSFLSFGCGVTYSVLVERLVHFILHRVEERLGVQETTSQETARINELWAIGFAYIVPGVLGLIACCVRRRNIYITHMVFSFVAIGILGALFLFGTAATGGKTSGGHFCHVTDGMCICEGPQEKLLTYFTCEEINRMVRMGISTDAMFFGGGIITFIAAILSICQARSPKSQQAATGTVLSALPTAAQQKINPNPYNRFYE